MAGATVLLVLLALSTWKFGPPFLGQFFLNPFQMFIVPVWVFAIYCVARGYVPLKHGGRIEREVSPRAFWNSVRFYTALGALFFIPNLLIAWLVFSRQRA